MRGLRFLLLAALSVACTKGQEFVTVTFGVSGVESGRMTRLSSDAVLDALSATAPSGPFTLTATSETNPLRRYTITTGVPVTMAIDSYTITGTGVGAQISAITGGALYSSPKWNVSASVSVSAEVSDYSVTASYPCVAFVIDKSVVSKMVFYNGPNLVENYSFGGTEDVGVVYAVGSWPYSSQLYVEVRPLDTVNYETVEYHITSREYEDTQFVKNGYWYNLAPGAIATASGSFGIEFPGWNAGE